MAPPRMSRPEAANPTEFSVDLTWQKVDGAASYKLYRRKIPDGWEKAKVTTVDGSQGKITLEDLEPTSTYQFRIAAVTSGGEEGPQSEDLTIDTAVANCTPKKKCVIS